MTKSEKRRIRMQVLEILDKYCQQCPYGHKNESYVPLCRQCPHGQRMQELARPLWSNNGEASACGKTGKWTEEEDFYILNHYGVQPIEVLSARTGRSIQAIRKRLETLKGGEPA
ncbi:hypothetical protein [Geobacillus thermodenitrificans]|uniref:hypothetical protein n=1 Tax=Geobacillus thermodenitrificans TaxID=33940 RepID=UPI001F4001A2|nr:hypothetical protein [Geobacillus thermodenitrificans]